MQLYAIHVVESGDSIDLRGFSLLPEEGFLLIVQGTKSIPTLEQLDSQFGEQLMPHFYTIPKEMRIEKGSIYPLNGYTHKSILNSQKNWSISIVVSATAPAVCRKKYEQTRKKMVELENSYNKNNTVKI